MSHRSTLSALTILLAVGGLFAVLAHAQDTPPADAAANPPGTMNQAQWIDMMKQMGLSDGMYDYSIMFEAIAHNLSSTSNWSITFDVVIDGEIHNSSGTFQIPEGSVHHMEMIELSTNIEACFIDIIVTLVETPITGEHMLQPIKILDRLRFIQTILCFKPLNVISCKVGLNSKSS